MRKKFLYIAAMLVIVLGSATFLNRDVKARGISYENFVGLESADSTDTGALYYAAGIFCCGKGNVRNCKDYPDIIPCP